MSIATRIGATNEVAASSIRSRCSGAVDHDHRRLLGVLGGEPRQAGEAGAVGRRVGDHQVAHPVLPEPERLRQAEGERALEARVEVHEPLEHLARADGPACDADRLAAGSPEHVRGVRPDGIEVEECERRLPAAEDRFEALVGLRWRGQRQGRRRVDRRQRPRLLVDRR